MSMDPHRVSGRAAACIAIALAAAPTVSQAGQESGAALVRAHCSGCHLEQTPGEFQRINTIRKSPEGWVMTLFRMRHNHGLVLSDSQHDALLHHLADTQGLAPSESAAGRFALERRPNAKDLDLGPELAVMCGSCHSLARVALQRRDAGEWLKHMHFHVGQYTSLEYHASARDRPWWQLATQELPAKLAGLFPYQSAAWTEWRQRPVRDLSGAWVVLGHVPGGRDFYGTATISREADGGYAAHYRLTDSGGGALAGSSHALVYTGYEWRGRAELAGRATREVFAAAADGNRISGRWFDADHAEDGGDWIAIRADGPPEVLAVLPRALRTGSQATLTVVGTGLGGSDAPTFGAGTRAVVKRREANLLQAEVAVAADAAPGPRAVTAGGALGQTALAIYRQVDDIEIQPGFGIARVGGGQTAPVTAQFEALGFARLAGGERLALGALTANWSVQPYDKQAKRARDEKFAGRFDGNGRFLPAGAGPNPDREYSGNNAGNLTVLARVKDGERELEGHAHLIVTVQRWNTPPIY